MRKPRALIPVNVRFWAKVDRNGPTLAHCLELGPCWVWTAGRSNLGYGEFRATDRRRPAHQIAWELTRGPVPAQTPRLCVLHRCDNRACVNPAHLWLGTHVDNMRDMARKGRSTRGERSARAKLTPCAVVAIRARYAAGATLGELSADFRVSERAIRHVVSGDRWMHLRLEVA